MVELNICLLAFICSVKHNTIMTNQFSCMFKLYSTIPYRMDVVSLQSLLIQYILVFLNLEVGVYHGLFNT